MPIDYSTFEPTEHQRLPEYKRDDVWIKSFLHKSIIGHIGHVSGDQPFITPSNCWFDDENRRIIFHSNISGRIRSNLEDHPLACFETSESGRFLPSNAALEFSLQYRSVIVFGTVKVITDPNEKRQMLENLIAKYFPDIRPETCNMISAITNRGRLNFMIFKQRFTSEVFLDFVGRLIKQTGKKLFLIVDGHPVHRSKEVDEWVSVHRKQIRLFFLPGYSPELNPDELLNQDAKTDAVGRKRPHTLVEMIHNLRSFLWSRQRTPYTVRNYFHAESVQYAAL